MEMEKRINLNNLIDNFIKNEIGSFKLKSNNLIKFRYEFTNRKNKDTNIFIYLKNWNELINLYKLIPKNNRHFYEIIDEKCKFFLDLDAKCQDIDLNEWKKNVKIIKQETKQLFKKVFNKDIEIIEYQSFPTEYEKKYSCHLIIPKFCFYAEDCKNICNMLLNVLNNTYVNIIDDKVYGNRRMLRIEGSTKINSNRIKTCINEYNSNYIINFNGLITNLENTEFLITDLYKINNKTDLNISTNYNKIIVLKNNDRKYNYTNNDIIFIKNNFKVIIIKINNFHNSNNIFLLNYIINNMIILKRTRPCFCIYCKRIHERQHPYIFVINNNIFFHCRRSPKPINISYILKEL
jgi:hypothetical protein